MLEDLGKVLRFAKEYEPEFIQLVMRSSKKELAKVLKPSKAKPSQAKQLISQTNMKKGIAKY